MAEKHFSQEKQIIFSEEMIVALLDGRKTMTRRILHAKSGWRNVRQGDRLWVRETWWKAGREEEPTVLYRADECSHVKEKTPWKAAFLMPRAISRLTLHVTDVKRQRLHEISRRDVAAEGIPRHAIEAAETMGESYQLPFKRLWGAIHGLKSWATNPVVVAIEFRVWRQNIDAKEAA